MPTPRIGILLDKLKDAHLVIKLLKPPFMETEVNFRVHNSPLLDLILCKINPVHSLTYCRSSSHLLLLVVEALCYKPKSSGFETQ
jgi:hypothetical protein